jgi:hypothetical protein
MYKALAKASLRLAAWLLSAVILVMLLVTLVTKAHAAEPCQGNAQIRCTKMHGAEAGCPVPCTGIVGPEDVIRAGAKCIAPDGKLAACEKKLELEKQSRENDRVTHESVLRAEKDRGDKCREKLFDCKPTKLVEVPWHEKPEFVAPITVVVTGLVVGLLVAVLYETGAVSP